MRQCAAPLVFGCLLVVLVSQPRLQHQGLRFVERADRLIEEGLAFAFNLQTQVIDGVDSLVQQRGGGLVVTGLRQCLVSSSSSYARAMVAAWCIAEDSIPMAVLPLGA